MSRVFIGFSLGFFGRGKIIPMNLRRKAMETMETVGNATGTINDAARMQIVFQGVLALGVIVAIAIGIGAMNRGTRV